MDCGADGGDSCDDFRWRVGAGVRPAGQVVGADVEDDPPRVDAGELALLEASEDVLGAVPAEAPVDDGDVGEGACEGDGTVDAGVVGEGPDQKWVMESPIKTRRGWRRRSRASSLWWRAYQS